MSRYRELKVYTKSYALAKEMYSEVAVRLPKEEQYGLMSQIKRASTSIPVNIAEGYGKGMGEKETVRHLMMARGSESEMEVWLEFLRDFGYLKAEEYEDYNARYEEVGKMLSGLIQSIRQ